MLPFLVLLFISSNCFAEPNPFTMVSVSSHELDRASYYLVPQGDWYELKTQGGDSSVFNINVDNENENFVTFAYLDAVYKFTVTETSDRKRVVFSMLRNGEPCGEPMAADLAALSTQMFTFLGSKCGFRFTAEWEYLGFTDVEIHQVWFEKQEMGQWEDVLFKRVDKAAFMKMRARIDSVSGALRVLEITDPQYFTRFEGAYASGGSYLLDEHKTDKRNGVVITKNGNIKAVIRAASVTGKDIAVYKPANDTEDFSIEKWNTMDRINGARDVKFIRVETKEGMLDVHRVGEYITGGTVAAAAGTVIGLKGAVIMGQIGAAKLMAGMAGATGAKAAVMYVSQGVWVGLGAPLTATGIGAVAVGATALAAYCIWENTKLIHYNFDLDGGSGSDLQVSWDKESWVWRAEEQIDLIVYLDSESIPTPPVTPPSGITTGAVFIEFTTFPEGKSKSDVKVTVEGVSSPTTKWFGNKLIVYGLEAGKEYKITLDLAGTLVPNTIKARVFDKCSLDNLPPATACTPPATTPPAGGLV